MLKTMNNWNIRWHTANTTTPKLITDYPTPFMIHNELIGLLFLNYKWFVHWYKIIPACLRCFLESVDTILGFLTHY